MTRSADWPEDIETIVPIRTDPERIETVGRLRADSVSFRRAGRQILDEVSVTAYAGEALAVTGPSGSGKSSLMALLAGLETPDSGTVAADDNPLGSGVPHGFGIVLQGYGLVSLLTAAENVEIVLQEAASSRAEVRERAEVALEAVGLSDVADHLVEELSGGQQQRVAVARALVIEPSVLLADEVTAELDAKARDSVLRLMMGVARRGGVVVLATHDPTVAEACHAQVRLIDGRVSDV